MGKLGALIRQWWPVAILLVLGVVAALDMTGKLGAVYRWMVHYMPPEVWSALAAWVAVAVGIETIVVAGRYAKQQVEKAQDQVHEAQGARLAQERQAQEALATQVRLANEALIAQAKLNQQTLDHDAEQAQRTRDEMAQPNVVMYAEPNADDWQLLEVVIKNFGSTPAFDIVPIVDPPLQSLPNLISGEEFYEIPVPPSIPILAPGQEWRTFWDSAVERLQKERELKEEIIAEFPGGPPTGTDFAPLVAERMPRAQHTGKVQYWDSRKNVYVTPTILDFNMLKGSMRAEHYGIHDIAKKLIKG